MRPKQTGPADPADPVGLGCDDDGGCDDGGGSDRNGECDDGDGSDHNGECDDDGDSANGDLNCSRIAERVFEM